MAIRWIDLSQPIYNGMPQAGLLDVHDASALPRWDAALRTKDTPHEQEHTW